jgi:hypothetical protein
MHETLRQPHGSEDVEKSRYDGEQLDTVETITPPSEMATGKRANLGYTKTGSRIVHEKVGCCDFLESRD